MHTHLKPGISGLVRLFSVAGDRWRLVGEQHNAVTYSGMDLLGLLLGGSARPINGMYIEFENGTAAADIVPPTLDVSAGVDYYTGLTGNRDFVRMPAGLLTLPVGSSGKYASNRVTFTGQSANTAGEHALPFSQADGTVAFGAALVSTGDTPQNDIVYARVYFDPGMRIAKQDMMQIGINWTTTLYHPEDTP